MVRRHGFAPWLTANRAAVLLLHQQRMWVLFIDVPLRLRTRPQQVRISPVLPLRVAVTIDLVAMEGFAPSRLAAPGFEPGESSLSPHGYGTNGSALPLSYTRRVAEWRDSNPRPLPQLVPSVGVEPTHLAASVSKTDVSASSTTRARYVRKSRRVIRRLVLMRQSTRLVANPTH